MPGEGAKVFHAGTALKDGALVATGGRVLNVTATGDRRRGPGRAYALLDKVSGTTASAAATSAGARSSAKKPDADRNRVSSLNFYPFP
jgi:phosphoribosylamine-glycine ligase